MPYLCYAFCMKLSRLLRISRPRFWLYEAGTFLVGCAIAYAEGSLASASLFVLIGFFVYFLIPANLYIYGINDIFDYETDKLNPKKVAYEALVMPSEHPALWRAIVLSTLPFLALLYGASTPALLGFAAFLFFAAFYSAPPIRAKAIPVLDSVFSAGHYVATGVFAYLLAGGSQLALAPIAASMAWAIAMHAYSAVPDIAADTASGVPTIATALGKQVTIILCALLYAAAAFLSFAYLGAYALVLLTIYLLLMAASYVARSEQRLFSIYTVFPLVNALGGMTLFFMVLLG